MVTNIFGCSCFWKYTLREGADAWKQRSGDWDGKRRKGKNRTECVDELGFSGGPLGFYFSGRFLRKVQKAAKIFLTVMGSWHLFVPLHWLKVAPLPQF